MGAEITPPCKEPQAGGLWAEKGWAHMLNGEGRCIYNDSLVTSYRTGACCSF